MTTIAEGRTFPAATLAAARDRLLRICAHLPVVNGEPGPLHARILVVADVLARTLEAEGRQLARVCALPEPSPERILALEAFVAALGVQPPASFTGNGEALDALGGPADVHVFGDGRCDAEQGVRVEVGSVDGAGAHPPPPAGDEDLLTLRLALLGHPYHRRATLTPQDVADAGRTLAHWRARVAHWACSPSKPVPHEFSHAAADMLTTSLDTPAVLDLLRRAEACDDMPEGAKFETFAFLDRMLGLELVREVGRAPLPETR